MPLKKDCVCFVLIDSHH